VVSSLEVFRPKYFLHFSSDIFVSCLLYRNLNVNMKNPLHFTALYRNKIDTGCMKEMPRGEQ
jgi:hypothetical protein